MEALKRQRQVSYHILLDQYNEMQLTSFNKIMNLVHWFYVTVLLIAVPRTKYSNHGILFFSENIVHQIREAVGHILCSEPEFKDMERALKPIWLEDDRIFPYVRDPHCRFRHDNDADAAAEADRRHLPGLAAKHRELGRHILVFGPDGLDEVGLFLVDSGDLAAEEIVHVAALVVFGLGPVAWLWLPERIGCAEDSGAQLGRPYVACPALASTTSVYATVLYGVCAGKRLTERQGWPERCCEPRQVEGKKEKLK